MKSVNVLVIEDETDKLQAVCDEVTKFFVGGADIITCGTFSEATRLILQRRFDLIIADLLLPRRRGDDAVDISEELVEHIAESELNQRTTVVAVSRYPEVVQARNGLFTKSAVFLVSYADPESWKSCLRVCMQRVAFRQVYDFVIVCALEEERNAFEAVNRSDFSLGALFKHDGLDCREMSIGDKYGVCVVQPRMGLVDAGIVSARALNAFSPRLICMAGICA
ncbi:hypothetical protein IQ250_25630, partial [Pseudanabaenaceae cyanobacterium LEGE 13415]|nr:hypothetical protein [Pseudanabaenaceae cyanobacterium LEGE 13415]